MNAALMVATAMAACGALLMFAEDLRNRREFDDDGWLAWPVAQLLWVGQSEARLGRLRQAVLAYPRFRPFLVGRLLGPAALLLALPWADERLIGALVLVVLVSLIMSNVRSVYGGDGADQMMVIVLVGLTLAWLAPGTDLARLGAWFVTAQLLLAYLISGIAKLISPVWRDGTGLAGVLSTYSYGTAPLSRLTQAHPRVTMLAAWSIVVYECAFWTVLFLPTALTLTLFALGALFHAGAAGVMRLNTFVFAFLAAYPLALHMVAGR